MESVSVAHLSEGSGGKAGNRGGQRLARPWVAILLVLACLMLPACAEEEDEGPAAPTGLTATAGTGQVTLAWDMDETVASYHLYWGTAPAATAGRTQIPDVTSPYTHTGLTSGATYYYVVTAMTAGEESPPSQEVRATPN
jgi:hypothetical protein